MRISAKEDVWKLTATIECHVVNSINTAATENDADKIDAIVEWAWADTLHRRWNNEYLDVAAWNECDDLSLVVECESTVAELELFVIWIKFDGLQKRTVGKRAAVDLANLAVKRQRDSLQLCAWHECVEADSLNTGWNGEWR